MKLHVLRCTLRDDDLREGMLHRKYSVKRVEQRQTLSRTGRVFTATACRWRCHRLRISANKKRRRNNEKKLLLLPPVVLVRSQRAYILSH